MKTGISCSCFFFGKFPQSTIPKGVFSKMASKLKKEDLTKYERARIIGARALQLALGAPSLIKVAKGAVNSVQIAFSEFEKGVIPLQVVRD